MSLNQQFHTLLTDYRTATQTPFTKNATANFIRQTLPVTIKDIIGPQDNYRIQGSAGQGQWAHVPWVAVFNRFITETAQEGYYLVYLVREDCAGLYLSLNQGVTTIRQQYGADTHKTLQVRAQDYLARLGPKVNNLQSGKIDLACPVSHDLGKGYEYGSVCAIYYPKEQLPPDDQLAADLRQFLDLYDTLAFTEASLFDTTAIAPDEIQLGQEDLRKLRAHKRIERNQNLAKDAKKHHGYICQACGFDFEKHYGEIGREFIEAHHLVPLGDKKGQCVMLNPKTDFAVLCANCHRMIHRSGCVGDVCRFQEKYLKNGRTKMEVI